MKFEVGPRPADRAAAWIARRLRDSVRRRGSAALALSGGSTAPPMIDALVVDAVPWDRVEVWQVDERVAPDGDPARNINQLAALPCAVHPMPVAVDDLDGAAERYAAGLPARFDIVHLGIGDDGHTASWPPDQPAVRIARTPVVVTAGFNGFRRMTLTRPVVNSARSRVVLAVGASKAAMVCRWNQRDPALPITAVSRTSTIAFLDDLAGAQIDGKIDGKIDG